MKAHFVLLMLATACGGGGGYEDLFGAPVVTTTTPDTIEGLWGGSANIATTSLDYRVMITDGSVTFASRCIFADGTKETVGVTVAASASDTDIVVKQSASDAAGSGEHACRIEATPVDLAAQLSGTNLVLSFPNGDAMALVKLSD